MPRTAQLPYRGFGRGYRYRWREWRDSFAGLGRRIFETLGAALVLASLLLLLALLTYNPGDTSLDTASDAPVRTRIGEWCEPVLSEGVGGCQHTAREIVCGGHAFKVKVEEAL